MGVAVGALVSPTAVGALVGAAVVVVEHVGPFAQLSGQSALLHTHVEVPTSESKQLEPVTPLEPQPAIGQSQPDAPPTARQSFIHGQQ